MPETVQAGDRKGMRDLQTAQLMSAQEKSGCILCRLVADVEEKWLWIFLWENVNDAGLREHLAASWGLCHRHAWMLVAKERGEWGSCQGTAILYRDLASRFLKAVAPARIGSPLGRLPAHLGRDGRPGSVLHRLEPRAPCWLCSSVRDMDEWNAQGLARALADAEFRLAHWESDGLCLPHLRRVLAGLRSEEHRDFLLDHQERVLERATGGAGSDGARRTEEVLSLLGGAEPQLIPREADLPRVGCTCEWCVDRGARVDGDLRRLAMAVADGAANPLAADLWRSLCRYHLWAAHDYARVAIGTERLAAWCSHVVAATLARLRSQPPPAPKRRWWGVFSDAWSRETPREGFACPVCVAPEDESLRAGAAPRGPLCLPHLRGLLRVEGQAVDGVLSAEGQYLAPLLAELDEYIRKFDYRFRDEPRGEEQTAWRRAVAFLSGELLHSQGEFAKAALDWQRRDGG